MEILEIWVPCQICRKPNWFKFENKGGYICKKCKMTARIPYWYVRCKKCGRIFYSKARFTIDCVECTWSGGRAKRKRRAMRVKDLLDGEMFYCLEYPQTIFLKYGNDIVRHAGPKDYDLDIVRETPSLFKVI